MFRIEKGKTNRTLRAFWKIFSINDLRFKCVFFNQAMCVLTNMYRNDIKYYVTYHFFVYQASLACISFIISVVYAQMGKVREESGKPFLFTNHGLRCEAQGTSSAFFLVTSNSINTFLSGRGLWWCGPQEKILFIFFSCPGNYWPSFNPSFWWYLTLSRTWFAVWFLTF